MSNVTAIMRRVSRTARVEIERGGYESASGHDARLTEAAANIKDAAESIEQLDNQIREIVGAESGRGGIVAKVLNRLPLPEFILDLLPERLLKVMAENADVLEHIEYLLRRNVDTLQEAVSNIAEVSIMKEEDLKALKKDIGKAIAEKWDAQELQGYLAKRSNIKINQNVQKLLDKEFNVLSEEEKERRRQALLQDLENNENISRTLMALLEDMATAGLQVFHRGMSQYSTYVDVYRLFITLRDSAQAMTRMNQSMYAARDALCLTLQQSVNATKQILRAVELYEQYAIASPKTREFIENQITELKIEIAALKAAEEMKAIGDGKDVIDAETESVPAASAVNA